MSSPNRKAFQSFFVRIAEPRKPLQNLDVMDLTTRVRLRLRDELSHKRLSQRAVAEHLTRFSAEPWTQVRVGRVLNGAIELKVEDVVLLAGVAGVSLVELFREPGREYVADLTPSELRVVQTMRERPDVASLLGGLAAAFASPQRKPSRRTIRERIRTDDGK